MNKTELAGIQIEASLKLLQDTLGDNLIAVYLYGSAVSGGLQKYSDIDLLAVIKQPTTIPKMKILVNELLGISGLYMKESKPPIELTLVVHSDISPWCYPPCFDFQYGEWMRDKLEQGIIDSSANKEMPDLAILLSQVQDTSKTIFGPPPDALLPTIPKSDVFKAMLDDIDRLKSEIETDTRNVLLTFARIWRMLETEAFCSKPEAADWAIERLPENYKPIMQRAKAICVGDEDEQWDDLRANLLPCANWIMAEIHNKPAISK